MCNLPPASPRRAWRASPRFCPSDGPGQLLREEVVLSKSSASSSAPSHWGGGSCRFSSSCERSAEVQQPSTGPSFRLIFCICLVGVVRRFGNIFVPIVLSCSISRAPAHLLFTGDVSVWLCTVETCLLWFRLSLGVGLSHLCVSTLESGLCVKIFVLPLKDVYSGLKEMVAFHSGFCSFVSEHLQWSIVCEHLQWSPTFFLLGFCSFPERLPFQ